MAAPDNGKHYHYKFGIFYHHKTDPKIWVPKADGLGYTLNFANKWSYVILFLILGIAAFIVVCAIRQKS